MAGDARSGSGTPTAPSAFPCEALSASPDPNPLAPPKRLPGGWTVPLVEEVLAQHRRLPLIAGTDIRAVQRIGPIEHPLECQLADRLAVLDHERDVAGPDLERGPAAVTAAPWVPAEAGIEEAGVVGPQFSGGWVVGHHLRRERGRDATA